MLAYGLWLCYFDSTSSRLQGILSYFAGTLEVSSEVGVLQKAQNALSPSVQEAGSSLRAVLDVEIKT